MNILKVNQITLMPLDKPSSLLITRKLRKLGADSPNSINLHLQPVSQDASNLCVKPSQQTRLNNQFIAWNLFWSYLKDFQPHPSPPFPPEQSYTHKCGHDKGPMHGPDTAFLVLHP